MRIYSSSRSQSCKSVLRTHTFSSPARRLCRDAATVALVVDVAQLVPIFLHRQLTDNFEEWEVKANASVAR